MEDRRPWELPGYQGALVSRLPGGVQVLVVCALSASLVSATAASLWVTRKWVVNRILARGIGLVYAFAGCSHFTNPEAFRSLVPHYGAWGGLWRLPGTHSFHVSATGVLEIAFGLYLLVSTDQRPAAGLFLLTSFMSFANFYCFTHNAPGPPDVHKSIPAPVYFHVIRFLLQVVVLTILGSIADAPRRLTPS